MSCVYSSVYACMCVYARMYACMNIYVYTRVFMYVCIYICYVIAYMGALVEGSSSKGHLFVYVIYV